MAEEAVDMVEEEAVDMVGEEAISGAEAFMEEEVVIGEEVIVGVGEVQALESDLEDTMILTYILHTMIRTMPRRMLQESGLPSEDINTDKTKANGDGELNTAGEKRKKCAAGVECNISNGKNITDERFGVVSFPSSSLLTREMAVVEPLT
jgi:hypothetical protein